MLSYNAEQNRKYEIKQFLIKRDPKLLNLYNQNNKIIDKMIEKDSKKARDIIGDLCRTGSLVLDSDLLELIYNFYFESNFDYSQPDLFIIRELQKHKQTQLITHRIKEDNITVNSPWIYMLGSSDPKVVNMFCKYMKCDPLFYNFKKIFLEPPNQTINDVLQKIRNTYGEDFWIPCPMTHWWLLFLFQ